MPTFVTLIELTPERRANVENAEASYERAVELVESLGGEVLGTFYGNIEGYDALTITEFPDRESFEKADLLYEMSGEAKANAYQVQTPEEFFELVDEVTE